MNFTDDSLQSDLNKLDQKGLKRQMRLLESSQGPSISVDGRDYLNFCSNK